jgi:hypothetical protein
MQLLASFYLNLNTLDAEKLLLQMQGKLSEEDITLVKKMATGWKLPSLIKPSALTKLAANFNPEAHLLWQDCLQMSTQAETISLMPGNPSNPTDRTLHEWVKWIESAAKNEKVESSITQAWQQLWPAERVLFNKLVTGRALFTQKVVTTEAKLVNPIQLSLVLSYVRSTFQDYDTELTLAASNGAKLASMAKLKLSDLEPKTQELVKLYVGQNTMQKFGPVRNVTPGLVFRLFAQSVIPTRTGYRLTEIQIIEVVSQGNLAEVSGLAEIIKQITS